MGRTLNDLHAFVRKLEADTPPERGVTHLTLRLLVQDLGRLSDLIEWMAEGELEMAEEEITTRLDSARELIRRLDELLATPAAPAEEVFLQGFRSRLSSLIDRVITASVERLPSDLHRQSINARLLRERHQTHVDAWQNARERLLTGHRSLERAVADLAYAYERRMDLTEPTTQCERLIEEARGAIADLQSSEQVCRQIDEELRTLHEATLPLLDSAHRTISEFTRIHAATETFGLAVPEDMNRQMQELEERLREMLIHNVDAFSDLALIDRDPTLQEMIEQTELLSARTNQILQPIRPSVFTRPLDRPEELRRLALIALCLYTDRPDPFNPKSPHKGVGKHTIAEVLEIADLTDPSERGTITANMTGFLDKSHRLADCKQKKFGWCYRVTEPGKEQTSAWFEEVLDQDDLKTRIERAIIERRSRQKKRPFGTARTAS